MTKTHDSANCTAGFRGQPCLMCHFAMEFEKSRAKSPSEALGLESEQDEFLESGGKNVSNSPQAQNRGILEPDFDYEWDAAPRSMKNYVEREIAEYFYLCGLRAGMRVEFENTNQTLRSLIGKLSQ